MSSAQSNFELNVIDDNARANWIWLFALGVLLVLFGLFAFGNLVTATGVTILYVGVMMSLAGAMHAFHSFQVKQWSGFFYLFLSGIFYFVAGILAIRNAMLVASTLTLLLSLTLIAAGVIRIWSASRLRSESGWEWVLISGMTTTIVGAIFLVGWPINSVWLLGMVLAVELTFQGAAVIALSLNVKKRIRASDQLKVDHEQHYDIDGVTKKDGKTIIPSNYLY